jgi:hypothetical protein
MSQFTFSTAFFKISKDNYEKYLYKKQLELYKNIDEKEYKNEIYFKNHFPLERIWYSLLREKLLSYKQKVSIPIIYDYPISTSH